MKKHAKRQRIARATRELLATAFPDCFAPAGAEKRPLALGVHDAVLAALPEIGRRRLAEALADYTSGPTYLRHVVEGAERIGLDGAPAGLVRASEAAHAALRLAALESWAAARTSAGEAKAA